MSGISSPATSIVSPATGIVSAATGIVSPAPFGNYSGVLDTLGISAAVAYGLRLLTVVYTGKCVNIRRSSDNATQDIGFDGSGNFNTATFSAFVGGGSGYVTTWYDQSGNANNAAQATAANQPQLSLTDVNGLPTLIFASSGVDVLTAGSTVAITASAWSAAVVAERTASFTSNQVAFGWPTGTFPLGLGFSNAANTAAIVNFGHTNVTAAAADNVAHSIIGVSSSSGSVQTLTVDGGVTTGTGTGTASESAVPSAGILPSYGDPLSGNLSEAIMFNSSISPTSQALIAANQKAYWGTP